MHFEWGQGDREQHQTRMTHLVFVYGSLKQGFPNTHVNAGRRLPGAYRTREQLPMYLLGEGHVPCLVFDPGAGYQVHGEVYEVDDAALAVLDRLERLGEPGGYQRVQIEVERVGSSQPDICETYVYGKSPQQAASEVERIGPLVEYLHAHARRFKWQGAV